MKAILQRVQKGSVTVDGRVVGAIEHGLVILLGIGPNDGEEQAQELAEKIARLRIFADENGKMNRSIPKSRNVRLKKQAGRKRET